MSFVPGQPVDPNPHVNLAEAVADSIMAPVFCMTITSGYRAFAWVQVGSSAKYAYQLGDGTGILNSSVDEIVALYVNGVAYTQVYSPGALAGGSKWMWDVGYAPGDLRVLIEMPGGVDVDPKLGGNVIELLAMYRFSNVPTDAGGYAWKPWITTLPSLQNRVAIDFNSISQIGGGSVVLQNETHFFDKRLRQNWDAGQASLYMGFYGLPWADFQQLATWTPSSAKMDDKNFTLNIQEAKVLLDNLYPSALYDATTYPNIDPTAIGSPIQVAYGTLHSVKAVCIDTLNLIFRVAGHAIYSFDQIRVLDKTTNIWTVVNFLSTNLPDAQFTMDPGIYTSSDSFAVDFTGKCLPNGYPMINPADVAQDLIEQLGFNTDAAGFLAAHNWYDIGYVFGNANNRVVILQQSIFLNTQEQAIDTLEEFMAEVRAYLTADAAGNFTMTPFRNYPVDGLVELNDNNVLLPGFEIDGSGVANFRIQAGSKINQVQVNFDIKGVESIQQTLTVTSPQNLYTRNLGENVPSVIDSLFTQESDAAALANALLNEYRVDPYVYTCKVKWLAFTLLPGNHVHVVDARHGIDVVCEIIQVQIDLATKEKAVTLTLLNLRGFEQSTGFWVNDTDTTPAGASLAWPANGELSDVAVPPETEYRRHQAGHWVGLDDFAVVVASATNPSDLDFAPSRWQ